jgi:hypothetical protein
MARSFRNSHRAPAKAALAGPGVTLIVKELGTIARHAS